MVTVIKKGNPIKKTLEKLDRIIRRKNQGVNAKKYSGTLRKSIDPLEYQQKVRNEWR